MNDTTRSSRRWLKRGWAACLWASWLAASALGQPPPLPPSGAPPFAASATSYQAYPIANADVIGVAGQLQAIYATRRDVSIAGNPQTSEVAVIGPADVQHAIFRWLADQRLLPLSSVAPAAFTPVAAASQPQPVVTQAWQLRNLNWKEFETRLVETWKDRLESSLDSVGDVATFRLPATAAGPTSIVVDHRTSRVTVSAPQSQSALWQRLMRVLDARPPAAGERTSIVPLAKADPQLIRRAVELVGQAAEAFVPQRAVDRFRRQHIGQFVPMIFQTTGAAAPRTQFVAQLQPGEAQPQAPAPESVAVGEAPPGSVAEAVGRLVGNVQIEILDDVVIVTGRAVDVERVLKIIEQIEEQSLQFKPEVEVYLLKHVDSQSLFETISQVQTVVFARQGPVTVVPLQKPNALMLVGRKENIPAMVELIQKLDQPAPPESESKVFQLRYMSAIDAERTIRSFFVTIPGTNQNQRTGLGTRVLVIAEYRSNVLIVQASPRDMQEVTRLIEALDIEASPTTQQIRVFKLRNSLASDLAPVLLDAIAGIGTTAQQLQQQQQQAVTAAGATSPAFANRPPINLQFLDQNGQQLLQSGILNNIRITADPSGNSLIVIAPASAMELMAAIIAQLDGLPATEAQIKVFSVVNGDATALTTMLQTLFGQPTGAAAQALQLSITPAGESTLVPLRFSVDQRTNTIIASGNAGDLEVVRAIVVRLDVADLTERISRVVRLNNAPAVDVATAINNLLTRQRDLNAAAPELVTPYQQIEREVLIEPEPVTNSLIISATPRYYERIMEILTDLDRRPPMVAIQVVIAEVTLTDDEQFGFEWGLQDALMFDRSIQTNRYAFNSQGFPNDNTTASLNTRENVAGQVISNLAMGRVDPTLGFGGLVLTASNESVNVLMRALEQSSRLQVISRPQVQTLDNQLAYVNVGALVPRITSAQQNQFGITNPSLTDISVGIILEVTPRTNPDGTIVMAINATKSSVGPEATGIPVFTDQAGNVVRSPQIPLTTAQTTVSARSGQTVILGGLITKDQAETTRRIPYLADIPALGRLFRFDSVRNQRTELLIILTPYIMQSDERNEWYNARESERMSWCLADLVNIHGPVGMGGHPAYNLEGPPLIFPDLTPAAPPASAAPAGPALPPPPQPNLYAPQQPMGAYAPPAVIVPEAGPLPAGNFGPPPPAGTLVPQTIQPAAPPAGTQAAQYAPWPPPAPPQFSPGPPIAPAQFQQPAGR